ncbi:hypothetical protein [Phenylobacterium sp.]|uniref:hypothetical protein n=1 Tax=Phenylobacterium sp. TaxID=1871053 RepID=UPI002810D4B2|nr:hypothetical protein [Phenylobacterium sp.]
MRRRSLFSLFAAMSLAACAHPVAPVPTGPDMAWSLNHAEGEGAKLAYGQPQTDNVLLMLTCEPRSGAVRVSMSAPDGGGGKALRLSSGGRSAKLAGQAAPSGLGDGLLIEAEARADDPVLARFAQSGELAVAVGARWTKLPADPDKSRRFVESCRGA